MISTAEAKAVPTDQEIVADKDPEAARHEVSRAPRSVCSARGVKFAAR